ncbi:MAG: tyrosine-type recombinase/integrase [Aliishimia sp.]
MTKRTPYLYPDADRHGNQRLYFKPPGHKKTRIRFAAGTKEAKAEYNRLKDLYEQGGLQQSSQIKTDSMEWLLNRYMASSTFTNLSHNTKLQRRNFFERFIKVHGQTMFAALTAKDLAKVRDALPRFSGRNFIKSMRAAYKWASLPENGYVDSNPAAAVALPSGATKGHQRWTLEDVLQFRDHYPQFSVQRKALACLLFTAREISGVRTLGRADVRNGMIRGYRQKTWADATTPVLSLLKDELGECYGDRIWIAKGNGEPFSVKSLPQRFSSWATRAELKGLTAHGLRKSVGTILADLGFSENTIMAALSHESASSAQLYVQGANKQRLARLGMEALEVEVSHIWKVGKP